MAKYTLELRQIVESGIPIFDFAYPFYDDTKRAEFEQRFIRHFYFREIGCDTIDRFKWYLQDKMNVVFPYYNKLLETSTIEYEITDNYKLTETYTRTMENAQKQAGVSSTRGRVLDENTSKTEDEREHNNEGSINTTDKTTTETDSTKDVTGKVDKTYEGTDSTTSKKVNKFLDTPQGATDIDDINYVTNINNESVTGSVGKKGEEHTATEENSVGNDVTETTKKGDTSTTDTGTEKGNSSTTFSGEQKTVADNNTRMYGNSEQHEQYTIVRKGNIGVDTDSDVIFKHIKLQKVLTEIEKMFFEECEDLFMMVY